MTSHDELADLAADRPLLLLPLDLRASVVMLWAAHRHLPGMDSPTPLCVLLAVWLRHHGLTESEAKDVIVALMSPRSVAKHRYASDLTTELALRAAETIERRHATAHIKRLKTESDDARKIRPMRLLLQEFRFQS